MLGPPIDGSSRPLTESAESRSNSASSRILDWRASNRLPGSIFSSSFLALRRLPVGRRFHDQPVHVLHAPTAVPKFRGEPVEQLRVSGPFALRTEIGRSRNQTGPEQCLPHAIDRYACGERIVLGDDPSCQVKSIRFVTRIERIQHRKHIRLHFDSGVPEIAPYQHVRLRRRRHVHDSRCFGKRRIRLAKLRQFLAKLFELQLCVSLFADDSAVPLQKMVGQLVGFLASPLRPDSSAESCARRSTGPSTPSPNRHRTCRDCG